MTIKELREQLDKIEKMGGETVYVYCSKHRIYRKIKEVYFDKWQESTTIITED